MANEVTVSSSLRCVNGELSFNDPSSSKQFDQTTARAASFTVDVGTTEETISLGDVAPGWFKMVNLDTTNYVQWGVATGVYPFRLIANSGSALVYFDGTPTIYVKANTAACKVQVIAINS